MKIKGYLYCQKGEGTHLVESTSRPGSHHIVNIQLENGLSAECTCEYFQFHHGASCHHIREILSKEVCGWTSEGSILEGEELNECPMCGGPLGQFEGD